MALYKYIRDVWKQPKANLGALWKERLIEWRREQTTVRISRPTRLDRARSLGYRAKKGIFVVRQRVLRGGRMRESGRRGRRPKHSRVKQVVDKSYQSVCEERAAKKFVNCEVLNSYFVAKDGKYYWYEVILVDKLTPEIKKDKLLKWMAEPQHKRRVFRGLTSAGKKSGKR